MVIYYVCATGSNEAPFDTPLKAATNFASLYSYIDVLGLGESVYLSGLVVEPSGTWTWYELAGGSIIGTDPLVDRIDLKENTFFGCCATNAGSGSIEKIGIFSNEADNEYGSIIWNIRSVKNCIISGSGFEIPPIEVDSGTTLDAFDIEYIGNVFTFDNCEQVIYVRYQGYWYDFYLERLNLDSRNWDAMAVAPNNDIYVLINSPSLAEKVYKFDGVSWVGQGFITTDIFIDVAVSPVNSDVYIIKANSNVCYCQYAQQGAWYQIAGNSEGYQYNAITVAYNGDVYIVPYATNPYTTYFLRAGGVGDFVETDYYESKIERYVVAMTAIPNGDVYAITASGRLLKYTAGSMSDFVYVSRTHINETGIVALTHDTDSNLYSINTNGAIFKKLANSTVWVYQSWFIGAFTLYAKGIIATSDNTFYISDDVTKDIYKSYPRPTTPVQNLKFVNNSIKITNQKPYIEPVINFLAYKRDFISLEFYNNIISGANTSLLFTAYHNNIPLFHKNNICDSDFDYMLDNFSAPKDETELTSDPLFLLVEPHPLSIDYNSPAYRAGVKLEDSPLTDMLGNDYYDPPSIGAYEPGEAPADPTIRKRQEGDVKMYNTLDNGDINVVRGITETDGGLFNIVYLSLFCGVPGWWGDVGVSDSAYKYQSETGPLLQSIPAVSGNLRKIESAVLRDLEWIKSKKIATSITVSASIPAHGRVRIVINVDAGPDIQFIENWKAST